MKDASNDVLENLREIFKQTRKARGFSHEKLAQRSKVTRAAISLLESSHRNPSMLMCLRIAKVLDLKLWEVLKKIEK